MSDEETLALALMDQAITDRVAQASQQPSKIWTGRVTSKDSDGTVYVDIFGGMKGVPCTRVQSQVSIGECVDVRMENGHATIVGNTTNPSAGIIYVKRVEGVADDAYSTASDAHKLADAAAVDAQRAHDAADSAVQSAEIAASSAGQALISATNALSSAQSANRSATNALTQLSFVEDVVGTLQWIQDNCTFELTSDTEVEPGKVYFTYSGGDYSPIVNPTGNPNDQGWYELDEVEQSQRDYIMAHICVTGRGLWVLPNGLGSSTTPASGETQEDSDARQGDGYKLLLSNDGTYIYDGDGERVSLYGPNGIEYASGFDWHVGGQNAYIFYDASEGTINIGGSSVVIGGSKTLAELIQQVDNTLIYDHDYVYSNDKTQVTFTARLYRGGEDIHTSYPASDFTWYLKDEAQPNKETLLGTGYTVVVNLSDTGYGAHIIGKFEPQNEALALTDDDDTLTTSDDVPIAVRTPSGDYIRVSDLSVETEVFEADKMLIVGVNGEHLVTVETMKDVFGDGDYTRLTNKPQIEGVTLTGDKSFSELGIFQTDSQGYDVPDDYTLSTMDINALWANAQPIGA